jgi:hypothetical protein
MDEWGRPAVSRKGPRQWIRTGVHHLHRERTREPRRVGSPVDARRFVAETVLLCIAGTPVMQCANQSWAWRCTKACVHVAAHCFWAMCALVHVIIATEPKLVCLCARMPARASERAGERARAGGVWGWM